VVYLLSHLQADTIVTNLDFKLNSDPDVTGTTALANKFKQLVKEKDLAGLEKLRRQYDKTGFTNTGAGKTAKAAEARAIRDTIDEFITPLSPEYKATKGDWQNANELLRLSSKGSYGAQGAEIPIVNVKTGKQVVAGAKSKAGNIMSKFQNPIADVNAPAALDGAGNIMSRLFRQGVTNSIGAGTVPNQDETTVDESVAPEGVDTLPLTAGGMNAASLAEETAPTTNDPFSPENVQANVQKILAQGGKMKDVSEYLAIVKTMGEMGGKEKAKPLNATQRKEANNAISALKDIKGMRSELAKDSSASLKSSLPGGSLTQRATGTTGYAASKKNVVDAIARLRSGAAITEDEAKRYMALLPASFDTPADANEKLDRLEELLYSFTYPEGGTGTSVEDLLSAQQ